jgi:hypothetical protein
VLGKKLMPLGCIWLNVTFGQPDDFHKEPPTFEVINFPDVYHALLSRSCFAKFIVVPNYTYLKLKMLSPKGVITIEGSFEQVYYYEQDCVAQAAAHIAPCTTDGSCHDIEGAPPEEATKAAVVLDQPSINEVPKPSGSSGGSVGPPFRRLVP